MKKFSFEKLLFWDEIRVLVKDIYKITSSFPDDEKFGLISQMRRSSISISSNIAEGTSRVSSKDQAHFSQIAYSSMMELLSQTIVSVDLGYMSIENQNNVREKIENLSRQINALRKSQLARIKR